MEIIARFENLKVQSCSHPRCRVACDSETHYLVCEDCKLETQVPCNHTKGELKSSADPRIAALESKLAEVTAKLTATREEAVDRIAKLQLRLAETQSDLLACATALHSARPQHGIGLCCTPDVINAMDSTLSRPGVRAILEGLNGTT